MEGKKESSKENGLKKDDLRKQSLGLGLTKN
jgi:hypothetical protein